MRRISGFTLLEMMLVIFLIGLSASVITMTVGDGGLRRDVEKQAKRFLALSELLSEEAIMTGNDYGLLIDDNSYEFLILGSENNWQLLEEERLYKKVELGEFIKTELKLDGFNWDGTGENSKDLELFSEDLFEDDFIEEDEEKRLQPQVFLFASGEMSAFTLTFKLVEDDKTEESLFKVVGQSSGQLMILDPEDEKWNDF